MKVVKADLLRDTETLGKMDPFVGVEYQGNEARTKVLTDAGRHPQWDETLTIIINSPEDEITITCYDEDMMLNDIVGTVTLKAKSLCTVFPTTQKLDLFFDDEKGCELFIETKYTPNFKNLMPEPSRDSPRISKMGTTGIINK